MQCSGRTITVNKAEVLETLKTNKIEHAKAHAKALEGWKEQIVEAIKAQLTNVTENGKFDNRAIYECTRPADHTKDYDVAIGMLEMDVTKEIQLTEVEYRTLVRDEWDWTENWHMSNSKYM
jgi:hypothetical protein